MLSWGQDFEDQMTILAPSLKGEYVHRCENTVSNQLLIYSGTLIINAK